MRLRPLLAPLVLAAAACDPPAPAASDADDIIARIEADVSPAFVIRGETRAPTSLRERMAAHHVPGVSVAVFVDGEVHWARGWGVADVESARAVTAGTLFQAASISKPVAAMGLLRMVEQGRLTLDEDVNVSLTSWEMPDNEFTADEKVTLRRILNHSAGTTVWGFPGYGPGEEVPGTVGVLDGEGNTEPIRVYKEPGESWRCSGGGYTVAQLLMADVAGQRFPVLMREVLLGPVGMTASTYEQPLPEDRRGEAATGYRDDGSPVGGRFHTYPEMAAAGLWTTPLDLSRLGMAVQASVAGAEGFLLSPSLMAEALEPGMNNHGLGFSISADGRRFGPAAPTRAFAARWPRSRTEAAA